MTDTSIRALAHSPRTLSRLAKITATVGLKSTREKRLPRYDPGIRLYVDLPLSEGADIRLSRDQAHYLRNVMRVDLGSAVKLFNGRDGEWRATVRTLDKRQASLSVAERLRAQSASADLWLVFAPVKRARIDFIAQKAAELGVSALWPVMTRYTDVTRVNADRLAANAVEASEQCARLDVPAVFDTERLDKALDGWPKERRILLCDETAAGTPIADMLSSLADRMPEPWAVVVGPEGGFAEAELARLHGMPNVVRVGLGDRLLRADTAAVAAIACWQAILGDWRDS